MLFACYVKRHLATLRISTDQHDSKGFMTVKFVGSSTVAVSGGMQVYTDKSLHTGWSTEHTIQTQPGWASCMQSMPPIPATFGYVGGVDAHARHT